MGFYPFRGQDASFTLKRSYHVAPQRQAVAEAQRGVELFTALYEKSADPYLKVGTGQAIALQTPHHQDVRFQFDFTYTRL